MSYLAVGGLLAIPALYYYLGYVKYKPRDWFFAFSIARAKMALARMIKHNELIDVSWKNILAKFPGSRPAMHFGESVYTLAQIEELSNRVANFLLSRGLKKGDCIALYMHNCPEYIAIWLGASKIGVVTALVNFNLKHIALVHSLKEASAKLVIFGGDLADNVHEVSDDLQQHPDDDTFSLKNTELFVHNGSSDIAKSLNTALENAAPTPVPADATAVARGVKVSDPLLYIYTSGTTGMPKAAVITHHRYYAMANAFTLLCSITSEDRIYIALPVYHSAAGIVGVGQMFFAGSTLIINAHNKGKFSASNFWPDVRRYGATVIQYIGEVCRYLVAQPADPKDGVHNVRVAIGNGLRPDVWKQFQTRFNIKHIAEFYGATEGAAGLMNTDNRFGAVGFLSPLVSRIAPMKLIKIDRETGEPIRDPKGFCIEADIDEPGEYIAKIMVESGVKNFMGYRSAEATKKKVLGDAFTKGDSWFRSGDLLRKDKDGFVFFVDRIGDTFRWKGENVSTNEVAEILSSFSPATQEPNVYGVSVPGQDGRAGMVAFSSAFVDSESKVVRAGEIDWPGFAAHVVRELPTYARPLFVRILPNVMETTGTFKHKKSHLVDQGFDPRTVKDPLYFLKDNQYVSLTPEIYDQIVSGAIRI